MSNIYQNINDDAFDTIEISKQNKFISIKIKKNT